ncbi:Conserved_hypothetical protein [Hexamita inflata]|uniref:Uncharacterized protein n=1 Tax=Hexamita inflata TaxID=28002 RepID=A0AA86N6I5_9EUKA|nr:Conserved hypothetical protein [Hexamita inflata]CAI9935967.1 Conserved hypothetical protein [Hexamita inflata]
MMDRQVIQTKAVVADQTQTQNTITIESDYNSIKSSMVKFEEQSNMTKFDTYSQIVIKKYINDKITYTGIENMITQLCSLAEYVWQNENSAGELRKFNVKLSLKTILITDTSIAQQMTDTFLDKMIDDTIQNNTKLQLLQLAQNILKISVKASGCLASCFK